ncbi:MAG: hypothetical protein RMJ82_11490 [Gemmatales bacterium]|nr:hypothetical protein [Gemmatales bacterium]
MTRPNSTWTRGIMLALVNLLFGTALGCHHYVCDGCGGCGGSCAGGQVYVVPADQKALPKPPGPATESIRKLPQPVE